MQTEVPSDLAARVTGDLKPQFDYEAEVKAARGRLREMLDKLHLKDLPSGLEPTKAEIERAKAAEKPPAEPAPPVKGGGY